MLEIPGMIDSLIDAAVLVALKQGPKTVAELHTMMGSPVAGLGLTVMHLEQAKLIVGYGLPRRYGMLDTGEAALKEWRRRAGELVQRAWDD